MITSYSRWRLLESKKGAWSGPIILIGPQGSGKSTTAKALAKKLGVPLISTDMAMIDPKWEEQCGQKPGVEVEIKRHPTEGMYYDSNDLYPFHVMRALLKEYQGKRVVLDVGGSHSWINQKLAPRMAESILEFENLWIFRVYGDPDRTYRFLKGRREGRGEKIQARNEARIKQGIRNLDRYYSGAQGIWILEEGKERRTRELVDEIIRELR